MRDLRMLLGLAAALLACALAAAPICASANARKSDGNFAHQPLQPPANPAQNEPESQPADFVENEGPFSIADQQYTVVLHEKAFGQSRDLASGASTFLRTLAELDIVDANSQLVFQETFPFALADGRFSQTFDASASLFSGQGGVALVIQFIEQLASTGAETSPARQSWQIFGLANGRLTKFGPVLPLGQGSAVAVGGVVTGVMAKGGIVVVPLASAAEELQVRAWTGNFHALVPVRIDWIHAQWGEAEQCYELAEGTLRERGCTMPVEAPRERASAGSGLYVSLFASVNDREPLQVPVMANSKIDLVEVLATAQWRDTAGRSECSFDNVWLRTRIDGKEGWVHGQESFAALGLPQSAPK